MPGLFQEMTPLLKRMDNYQHLLIMDLIVMLHGIETLGIECNRVPFSILLRLLQEDSSSGKVRAIHLHTEGQAVVRGDENRLGGHCTFQSFKGYLLSICPLPRLVL